MTKEQYVAEMLSDALPLDITVDKLKEIAKDIVDGLDMWYELSGDSVATDNRYAAIENEKNEIVIKYERELAEEYARHSREIEEANRNARWKIARQQEKIEELQKQIR